MLRPDHPLPSGPGTLRAEAGEFGAGVVEGVLIDALARGQTWAAAAAAEVLGDVGTEALLDTAGAALVALGRGRPQRRSPVALCGGRCDFAHPSDASLCRRRLDRRRLDRSLPPPAAIAGRWSAIRGSDARRKWRRLLAGLGYEADVATNSRQFMELASQSPDYEMALVDVSLGSPPVDDLIGRLRRDPRTADLPIGVMVGEDLRSRSRAAGGKAGPGSWRSPAWPTKIRCSSRSAGCWPRVGRDQVEHEARQAQAAARPGTGWPSWPSFPTRCSTSIA